MADGSLYLCSPCFLLFRSLEEVLAHQTSCHPDSAAVSAPGQPAESCEGAEPWQSEGSGPETTSKSSDPSPPRANGSGLTSAPPNPGDLQDSTERDPGKRAEGVRVGVGVHGAPLIRYQCGECGALFRSLSLWQRHSKRALCRPPAPAGKESEGPGEKTPEAVSDGNGKAPPPSPSPRSAQPCLCVRCGWACGSEEALAAHLRERHGQQMALHRCPLCAEEFMNTTQFLYHRRQHRQRGETGPATVPAPSANPLTGSLRRYPTDTKDQTQVRSVAKPDEEAAQTGSGSTPAPPSSPSPGSGRPAPADSCPSCGWVAERRTPLRAPRQRCHGVHKPYRCPLCRKCFAHRSNLSRHRLSHAGRGPGARSLLLPHGRGGGEEEEEKEEEEEEEGEGEKRQKEQFACDDCSESYATQAQLLLHRLVHIGQSSSSCSTCGRALPSRTGLDHAPSHHLDHAPSHHLDHTPSYHGNPSQARSQLGVHLPLFSERAGPGREEDGADHGLGKSGGGGRAGRRGRLRCETCGHRCVTQEGLELHRLSHSGRTPLRCPLLACRRRFPSDGALQEHLLGHGPVPCPAGPPGPKARPHRCNHCSKAFTTTSSLNVHLRIHTGERPFQCGQCGKRFRQIPHLRDHERLHTGERPFVCGVCGRGFVLAARLAEHARTHSGDKPYQCPLCHRAFRSLSNLGKHRKLHTANLPAEGAGDVVASPAAARGASGKPKGRGGGRVGAKGDEQVAVHTILLVQQQQTPPPDCSAPASSSVPVVILQPSVAFGDGPQGVTSPLMNHAIEVIVSETVE